MPQQGLQKQKISPASESSMTQVQTLDSFTQGPEVQSGTREQ